MSYSNYNIAVDTRSITAMNGSVQGYGSSYKTIDAREYNSLRSQRLSDLGRREEPFHLRGESVRTASRRTAREMSDFDRLFAEVGRR